MINRYAVLIFPLLCLHWGFPSQPCDAQPMDMEGMPQSQVVKNGQINRNIFHDLFNEMCRALGMQISALQLPWLTLACRFFITIIIINFFSLLNSGQFILFFSH